MTRLLTPADPYPVLVKRETATARVLLVCEHAGRAIPETLGDLGLPEVERMRHIGWDIGAFGLAQKISALLDAVLIAQAYSRLVVDCNRRTSSPTFITRRSEATDIPGNLTLDADQIAARTQEVWQPFQDRVANEVAARKPAVLFAIHSFTPMFLGEARPWHCGFLHADDDRAAVLLNAAMQSERGIVSALNQPYVCDEWDYTVPVHGDGNGVPAVLIEIRQDLIADEEGQDAWAARLAPALRDCAAALAKR